MYTGTGRHDSSLLSEGTHYQKTGGGTLLLYGLVRYYQTLTGKPAGLLNAEPKLGIDPEASHRHGCGVFHACAAGDEDRVAESDTGYPLRRAVMLRGPAGLRGTTTFNIDAPLLTALGEISFYRHGARSIEKVLEQIKSRSRGGRMRLSHLPPDDILDLHVEAEEFRRLLSRDLEFQRMAADIAPGLHRIYLENAQSEGWDVKPEVICNFE